MRRYGEIWGDTGRYGEGVTVCTSEKQVRTLTLTLTLTLPLPLSRSEEQVRETFNSLQGTVNVLGRTNREVLIME